MAGLTTTSSPRHLGGSPFGQALCLLLLAGLLAGLAGCRPSSDSAPGGNAALPAAEPAATNEVEIARVLGELTQQVRKYGVEQRQAPQSLEDLVAKGYLERVPPAPDGKRFVITKNLQVQLASH